jgi:hypothetical protein
MRFCTSAKSTSRADINHRRRSSARESGERKSFTLEANKCSEVAVGAHKLTRGEKCAPRSILQKHTENLYFIIYCNYMSELRWTTCKVTLQTTPFWTVTFEFWFTESVITTPMTPKLFKRISKAKHKRAVLTAIAVCHKILYQSNSKHKTDYLWRKLILRIIMSTFE